MTIAHHLLDKRVTSVLWSTSVYEYTMSPPEEACQHDRLSLTALV